MVKADNREDLVATFPLDAVKSIVAPPSVTLSLIGETSDDETFTGSDTVPVIVGGKK